MLARETAGRDAEVIRNAADGDRTAFAEIVELHQAAVFRFARSIARTDTEAEDALQETFLSAWRNAESFRGDASLRTWLLTIARNAVLRLQRRRVDEPEEMQPLEELGLAAGLGEESPENHALRNEARDVLTRALHELNVADREILLLRDVEGLSGADVAAVLGVELAAMKTRLHRARLRLAAKVKGIYGTA